MDIKDFMEWTWDEDLTIYVTIRVKDYIPIDFEYIEDLIQEFRIKSRAMIIKVDLHGAKVFRLDIRNITQLLIDINEHTKNDVLLRQIQFIGSSLLFRGMYRPISMIIPKHIRDMIIFLRE
jgi:hypothetical protein